MGYLFVPPVVEEGPMGGNWLFARYTRKQGVTVTSGMKKADLITALEEA